MDYFSKLFLVSNLIYLFILFLLLAHQHVSPFSDILATPLQVNQADLNVTLRNVTAVVICNVQPLLPA